ncbi:MAG TPA: helix-hairpin-helix domain-containing protein [Elusimicrobiota bacterium]|nr:helix-hairpin-helix domain-containing protein [Elusimicrobiota bacterium]
MVHTISFRIRQSRRWLFLLFLIPSLVLAADKIDINLATIDDLKTIPGMTDSFAEMILYQRQQLGSYASMQQMLYIPGMTPEAVEAFKQYLHVPSETAVKESTAEEYQEEIESEEGFSMDTPVKGDEDALQELAVNPLDINLATVDDWLELPMIDKTLARKLVSERRARKKFKNVQELLTVPGMTPAILAKIKPYIARSAVGKTPAFSGDLRLRMRNVNPRGSTFLGSSPEFQNNTYLYNRVRMKFGQQSQAGWLTKRASVGASATPEHVQRVWAFKYSIQETDVAGLDKVIVGNYTLCHGQGLIFYDGLGEYVRPAKVKGRGAKQDFTSGSNDYLKGAVVDSRLGPFDTQFFISQKELDMPVNKADGTISMDLYTLRDIMGDVQDADGLVNNDTVSERLYGGRISYRLAKNTTVGFTGYESHYSRVIDPTGTTYADSHVFRGNKNIIQGFDFDTSYRSLNLFGEMAESHSSGPNVKDQSGKAWTMTPMFRLTPFMLWISLFDYDAEFFTRHGKGVSYAIVGSPEQLTDNQKGSVVGFEYTGSKYKNRTNYYMATFPRALGSEGSSKPLQESQGRQIYFENFYSVTKPFELYFRYQRSEQDANLPVYSNGINTGIRRQALEDVQKYRYQVTWRPSQTVRYRARYETRFEDYPGTNERQTGHLLMGDVLVKPTRTLSINGRMYFFHSNGATVTSGVEEIWNKVVYYRLAGAMNTLTGTPGNRFYLIVKQAVDKDIDVWFKFDVNRKPRDLSTIQSSVSNQQDKAMSAAKYGFHAQLDYRWGGSVRKSKAPPTQTASAKTDWAAEQE